MKTVRHCRVARSMTLMAGPIDTRVQPSRVDELAVTTPLAWFEQHLIDVVPLRFPGRGGAFTPATCRWSPSCPCIRRGTLARC